jgi:hypothetical protein
MAARKGIKPANQINSLAQASKLEANPQKKTRKYSGKPRKVHHYVEVFFTYANGNITTVRVYDTIARYAALTLVTAENKFYKEGEKILAHRLTKGRLFKVGSFGKGAPSRVGVKTPISGNTRKFSKLGGDKYHTCHAPSDASVVDILHWVSSWKRMPSIVKVGKEKILTGNSKTALVAIGKPLATDPIAAASK